MTRCTLSRAESTEMHPSTTNGDATGAPLHTRPASIAHRQRRIRVLLIAEACNPDWTSVPLEGYNLYRGLRHVADITLAT